METKTKIVKEFDTVKTFREIKDKISKNIKGMTFEQLQAYLDKIKLKSKNPQRQGYDQQLRFGKIRASPCYHRHL